MNTSNFFWTINLISENVQAYEESDISVMQVSILSTMTDAISTFVEEFPKFGDCYEKIVTNGYSPILTISCLDQNGKNRKKEVEMLSEKLQTLIQQLVKTNSEILEQEDNIRTFPETPSEDMKW